MHLRHLALALVIAVAGLSPAGAQDAAEFVLRLNRLENQVRSLSGQIEQLQFENRQLKDQARKFQEDVEYRFQERCGGSRNAAPPAAPASPPGAGGPSATPPTAPRPPRRGDAFDPDANPNLPGSPRPLGSTQPSAPLPAEPRSAAVPVPRGALDPAPADGTRRDEIAELIDDEAPPEAEPLDIDATRRAGPPVAAPRIASAEPPPSPAAPSIAATGSADPRADYDVAYAYLLQRQYEQAEMGFRRFLQSHPRDRLVPEATFWLGESYLQRGRAREAAEQFVKVSTDHAKSAKAPDAMLKLGVSLNQLGAKDQACATFAELERKYPQSAPGLKPGIEREQKRARCPT